MIPFVPTQATTANELAAAFIEGRITDQEIKKVYTWRNQEGPLSVGCCCNRIDHRDHNLCVILTAMYGFYARDEQIAYILKAKLENRL